MSTSPNKTAQSALLAWQDLASGAEQKAVFNCNTHWGAGIWIRLVRETGSAFTSGWPNVRIETSFADSGDNSWCPATTYTMAVGASIANTTLSGSITAGATTFGVTANTNIAVGDLLFISDSSTSNYEIVRVKSLSGTTVTTEEPIVNNHSNAALVTDQAEVAFRTLDLTCVRRFRVVADNSGSGQACGVEVRLTTFDSYG